MLVLTRKKEETLHIGADVTVTILKVKGNSAPVYMLSSVGDALNANIDYGELGLTGVFQKPIHPDRMLKTIKSHLS